MPSGKRSSPPQTLGVLLDRVITAAEYADEISVPAPKLGTRVLDEDGNEYTFVVSGGTIAAGNPVKIAASSVATAAGNAGVIFGVAHVALASGEYGFVQTRGVVTADIATSTASGAQLARVADANGDFAAVAAATGATRGVALAAESGGSASVYLD